MAKRKSTSRSKRRSSEAPMPSSGAGLIRFFADSAQGWKIGPIWIVSLAGVLIVFAIIAQFGILDWLFGG